MRCLRLTLLLCGLFGLVVLAAIPASDDFNRDDAASLGANWTGILGTLDTNGTQAYRDASSSQALNIYHWATATDNFDDDQLSSVTCVAGLSATDFCAVLVRASGVWASSTFDAYYLVCTNTTCNVGEYQNSAAATLCAGVGAIANGDLIKLEVEGSGAVTLRAYEDDNMGGWTQMGSDCTDGATFVTGGQPGIRIQEAAGTDIRLDDWDGDNLSAGAATIIPVRGLTMGAGR